MSNKASHSFATDRFLRFACVAAAAVLAFRLASTAAFPLHDPSESRYAVMAKNMAATGDFMVPRFTHEGVYQSFDGKPPLFFQLAGRACQIFGIGEFAVRLPSFLAGLAILLMLGYAARRLLSGRVAAAAVLLTAMNPVFYVFMGLSLTDTLLAACIDGAVLAFALCLASADRTEQRLFGLAGFAALALGMLTKGPVAILMAGEGLFFFVLVGKRWRALGAVPWVTGTLLFLAIALPWFLQMQRLNPDFFRYFFVEENFHRFTGAYQDRYGSGHVTFRGVAVLWMIVLNLPALLTGLATAVAAGWKKVPGFGREPLVSLSLWSVIGMTLFWLPSDKALIYYLLPTIPFGSVLAASLLEKTGLLDLTLCRRALGAFTASVGAITGAALIGVYCITAAWGEKCPGFVFKAVRDTCRSDADLTGRRIYFVRRLPYSAEFYLGNAVAYHRDESVAKSQAAVRDDMILAVPWNRSRGFVPGDRRQLAEGGVWAFYGPARNRLGYPVAAEYGIKVGSH